MGLAAMRVGFMRASEYCLGIGVLIGILALVGIVAGMIDSILVGHITSGLRAAWALAGVSIGLSLTARALDALGSGSSRHRVPDK